MLATADYPAFPAEGSLLSPEAKATYDAVRRLPPEKWRVAWRVGIAPCLPTAGLRHLRDALRADDGRLIQGRTVSPTLLESEDAGHEPCMGACAIGFAGWKGLGLSSVFTLNEWFAATVNRAGELLPERYVPQFFTRWFDETPRAEMIRELLPEVERSLASREEGRWNADRAMEGAARA